MQLAEFGKHLAVFDDRKWLKIVDVSLKEIGAASISAYFIRKPVFR